MNSIFEENMMFKRKLADFQNRNRLEEKKQIKQQEYLVQLETKYREMNEKVKAGFQTPHQRQRSNNLSFNAGGVTGEEPSGKKLPFIRKRPDSTTHNDKQKQGQLSYYVAKNEDGEQNFEVYLIHSKSFFEIKINYKYDKDYRRKLFRDSEAFECITKIKKCRREKIKNGNR